MSAITPVAPVTAPKTVVDVLRDARALYAENPSHAPLGASVAEGTHCVITAVNQATRREPREVFWAAMRPLELLLGSFTRIATWNAEHTTEEVLEVWDRVLADAEAAA